MFGLTKRKTLGSRPIESMRHIGSDLTMLGAFATDLIYFCHKDDTDPTQITNLGPEVADYLKDRTKAKSFYNSSLHIANCKACTEWLERLLERLNGIKRRKGQ